MLLAEDGLVDIDAPVATHLDGLCEAVRQTTLRQFMTHTSGIRCTLELGTIANGFALQPRDWQTGAVRRQTSLQYEPGTGQLYCNGVFVMMSDLIEQVSGESYPAFMKRRIFEPLGMFDTDIVENDHAMIPGMASPHVPDDDQWQRPPVDADIRGDGGIVSTVDDMLRWLEHLRGQKRIGTEATWEEMLRPVTLQRGFTSTYAMGIKRHTFRGVEVLQHSGGLFGLNAQIITVPEHELDIAVAINGAPASATRTAFAVLEIWLDGALQEPAPHRPDAAGFTWLLGRTFAHPSGLLLTFDDMNGELALAQMHMQPAPILYEDETSIFALFEEIGFGPLVWKKADLADFNAGRQSKLKVEIAGETCWLEPLQRPECRSAEVFDNAVGRYASKALSATLDIAADSDGLKAIIRGDYSGARSFEVSALSDRHAGIASQDGAERYAIEFDFSPEREARGLWVDTHRARRVRFERMEDIQP